MKYSIPTNLHSLSRKTWEGMIYNSFIRLGLSVVMLSNTVFIFGWNFDFIKMNTSGIIYKCIEFV